MFDPRMAVLALGIAGAGVFGFDALRAQAHGGGFRGFGRGDHPMMHKFLDFAVDQKLDEIGATDVQKEKVRAVKDRLLKSAHALRETREPMREEIVALLQKDSLEPGELKAAVHARAESFVKLADEAADAVAELHGILTPEQRAQLLKDLSEHHQSRHHH